MPTNCASVPPRVLPDRPADAPVYGTAEALAHGQALPPDGAAGPAQHELELGTANSNARQEELFVQEKVSGLAFRNARLPVAGEWAGTIPGSRR